MSQPALAVPATGRDLLPPVDELRRRMAANSQERRVLRDLLRIVEKDTSLRESVQRIRAAQAVAS